MVGAGPNGLAAAVTLARAGVPVTVFEAHPSIGGGTRTSEVVRPGVLHDVCSAIHPMALATEFMRAFEIERRTEFVVPEASYANPLSDRYAAVAYRDLDRTAARLGADGRRYSRLFRPLVDRIDDVVDFALGGAMLRRPRDLRAALAMSLRVAEQGTPAGALRFGGEAAPALVTGVAGHSIGALPGLAPAAVGLVLGALAHTTGWPVPVGGSRRITDALAADLIDHGGRIETNHRITDLSELSAFDTIICNTSARVFTEIAGSRLPTRYARSLRRFRYGDGATKVDFVLDGPIPWGDPEVALAPTAHLGGTRAETARAELDVSRGRIPEHPYVLLAQPDGFDTGRNPEGVHAIWSYAHVPSGSDTDMRERVTAQIERFAPGFRDRIVDVRVTTARELEAYNPNYHGGDFSAGAITMPQLLARPTLSAEPWRTPLPGVYLASSSTPPGPGVHGLNGWYAAQSALRRQYGLPAPALGIEA